MGEQAPRPSVARANIASKFGLDPAISSKKHQARAVHQPCFILQVLQNRSNPCRDERSGVCADLHDQLVGQRVRKSGWLLKEILAIPASPHGCCGGPRRAGFRGRQTSSRGHIGASPSEEAARGLQNEHAIDANACANGGRIGYATPAQLAPII